MSETYADCVATVELLASESFNEHVLTIKGPWQWKCARPASWAYGFFVLVAPGALIVYGDLVEAIFRMAAGTPEEVLAWTYRAVNDRSYLLSKISNKEAFREFYAGDAIAWAETTDWNVAEVARDIASDGGLSEYKFYEAASELGCHDVPDFKKPNATALWLHEALKVFIALGPQSAVAAQEG